jgi:hypothetical protein
MKLALSLAIVSVASLSSAAFADSYSTGFEDFTLGPISSGGSAQNGWSGGAQADFTNNDAGDEAIVNTTVHSGGQAWHYARGYNSPGQGTAYTPNLTSTTAAVGTTMTGSLWFKAGTPGDNSSFALETGNVAGDDRAEIVAYVENFSTGLTIRSFTTGGFVPLPIAVGVDNTAWHQLSFTVTQDAAESNQVSLSIDGGTPVTFGGSLAEFRDLGSFAYSESSRIKLRPRHVDGDPNFDGFYFDDISYSIAVPEPTTLAALAGAGVFGLRRRRA